MGRNGVFCPASWSQLFVRLVSFNNSSEILSDRLRGLSKLPLFGLLDELLDPDGETGVDIGVNPNLDAGSEEGYCGGYSLGAESDTGEMGDMGATFVYSLLARSIAGRTRSPWADTVSIS
jgi:hypothetical protein